MLERLFGRRGKPAPDECLRCAHLAADHDADGLTPAYPCATCHCPDYIDPRKR